MDKQDRFYSFFNSLSYDERKHIAQSALKLSEQFYNGSVAYLMEESRHHAQKVMSIFCFKKQKIYHATLFAALQYAINYRQQFLKYSA